MKTNSDSSVVVAALAALVGPAVILLTTMWPMSAKALPLFNRQTGQNCIACHAGGQFPELTPYGRMFKLTGYTLGQRTVPISVMALASYVKVANTSKSDDPSADFQKNQSLVFPTASIFLGGKATDNIGGFAQITYNNYATQSDDGKFHGHTQADNIDLRYADRFIDNRRDLIAGVSFNNNPSISDPWNTAPAWMQYVPVPSPTAYQFIDGASPYPSYGPGGNLAGLTAYVFWNRTIYAELGGYRSSEGLTSFMSAGLNNASKTKLKGTNPYWRLAWNHEWGAHALMVGTAGMNSKVYDNPLDTSNPASVHHFNDWSVDSQYQYLLDPHSVTAQLVYARRRHRYPDFLANQPSAFVDSNGNPVSNSLSEDTTNIVRAKLTYVFQARYGGSLAFFNLSGTTSPALQTSGFDPATLTITSDPAAQAPSTRVTGNLSGNPGTRGFTYEAFYTPIQYMRVGLQYTAYSRFNGASQNYDGFGRNARDNNSLFLYLWAAY